MIDLVGRKIAISFGKPTDSHAIGSTMAFPVADLLLYTACIAAILFVDWSALALASLLVGARFGISGAFQAAHKYTSEIFPAPVRRGALQTCRSVARIGYLVTPLVAQLLASYELRAALGIYASIGLLGAIVVLCRPLKPSELLQCKSG